MENKPLKRSRFLIELSRDHHSGLLFCWKIKAGLKKDIALHRILNYILFYWRGHLEDHFRKEEILLFNRNNSPFSQQGKNEHQLLKQHFRRLNYDLRESREEYELFAELLMNHIRFEERILFPYLETAFSEEILKEVGLFLASQHAVKFVDDYPDQFWLKTNDE